MHHFFLIQVAACVVSLTVSANADAQKPKGVVYTYVGRSVGLAPHLPSPNPSATIVYRSEWQWPAKPGIALSYCVFPSVEINSRHTGKNGSRPLPWTTPFTLELIAADSTASTFTPVTVRVPIKADTTQDLRPIPPWCGTLTGSFRPPELYLRVDGRTARVQFATPRQVGPGPR